MDHELILVLAANTGSFGGKGNEIIITFSKDLPGTSNPSHK